MCASKSRERDGMNGSAQSEENFESKSVTTGGKAQKNKEDFEKTHFLTDFFESRRVRKCEIIYEIQMERFLPRLSKVL